MAGQTISNRFKLNEELSSDSLISICKAQDLRDNKTVFITLFSEKSLSRPLEVQLRFKRAVEQVSKLDHPNLLKTLEVAEAENRPYLVSEYIDSIVLSDHLNQPQNVNQPLNADLAVDLVIQISSVLSLAHEHNLLHQAIKPQNILIGRKQGQISQVKLFNFGYSILQDISRITGKEEIISTFGYLSPESSGILRKPIDLRSDIYSLGILFYQLLTGRLPYMADDVSGLIHQHIAIQPLPPSHSNSQVPPVLDNITLRLIAKEPSERYQSLKGLLHDLAEYQKQRKEGKALIDFEIARQDRLSQLSFSTRLIGRDKELNELNNLLNRTRQDQGALAFVYGEPGIGKSRLVDELRGSVHSMNGLFCGGKCYQYEFRTPYKVFSEAIDAYIDKIKRLSAKEQEVYIKRIKDTLGELGGEVVKLSPSITDLIGQPPKLAELEPEKEKIRFLITVTNFLTGLSSPASPMLMFLDDLQWVDEGSLDILERLAEKLRNSPVLLVVSYRDTDVSQNHPLVRLINKFKEQQTSFSELGVRSFSLQETSQMVSQIVMETQEAVLPLADELQKRANGNPFFTLELLHSLFDSSIIYLKDEHYVCDAGQLKNAALPTTIVEAVLRRMKDLSHEHLSIISYASVMGKEIKFELLTELANEPADKIVASLEDGIRNQLLFRDLTGRENIFFMHDRIREAFYQRVPNEERIPLHRHIAQLLEEQNKADLEPFLYDLAYHFAQGQVEDKALQYTIPAANKAKMAYANTLAIDLFNSAKEILEKQNKTKAREYIEVLEDLGEVCRFAGRLDESLRTLTACESLIPREDKIHRVRVLAKMGDTRWENGQIEESAKLLEEAFHILGVNLFKTKVGVMLLGISYEFTVQMLHMLLPGIFVRKEFKASQEQLFTARILNRIGHIYYFTDIYKAFYVFLKSLNFSEKLGPSPELAYAYLDITASWGVLPIRPFVERSFKQAIDVCRKIDNIVLEGIGYGYYSIHGCYSAVRPKEGVEYAQKAISILKPRGELWDMGIAYAGINFNTWIFSSLKKNASDSQEMIDIMKEAVVLQPWGWGLFHKVRAYAMLGDIYPGIIAELDKADELFEKTKDYNCMVGCKGVRAFTLSRMKQYDKALEAARTMKKWFPIRYGKGFWVLECLPEATHAYLDYIVNTPGLTSSERKKHLKEASWFVFNTRLYSIPLMYPFIRGYAYQVFGTYLWLTGHKKRAARTWERGLKILRTNKNNPGGDKYRIAYILLEEAKFLLQDNPKDKKAYGNLIEARDLFSEMSCNLDLETTNKLLENISPEGISVDSRTILTQKRHLDSLLSVTQAIGSIFILDELLQKILEYGLKVTGAERGFLLLSDEKTNQLSLKVSSGLEKDFQGLSFSYDNYKISLELISEVRKSKTASIADQETASSPKISTELKSFSVRQAIAVPLQTRDKLVGILYLDNRLAGGTFGKDELELMKSFAVQSAVSIENAFLVSELVEQGRLKQELELGKQIQESLLPKKNPDIPGLKLTGIMLPAKEIGGDYYDFIELPNNNLAILIGDVSGKGVAAGLLMAIAKATIKGLSKQELTPRQILIEANNVLYEYASGHKFMSMLYMKWDVTQKKLAYSSAGHEHILVYRSSLGQVEPIISGGFVLGILPDISQFLEDKQVVLNPGDKIVLYTDGVTEAHNQNEDFFELEGLIKVVNRHGQKPVEELLGLIKEEVYSYMGTREQYDDITLVVMEAK